MPVCWRTWSGREGLPSAHRPSWTPSAAGLRPRGAIWSEIEVQLAEREEDAFAERRVRLEHVEQRVRRGLAPDRARELLQPFARLRPCGDRARQHAPRRIGDDLHEPAPLRPL